MSLKPNLCTFNFFGDVFVFPDSGFFFLKVGYFWRAEARVADRGRWRSDRTSPRRSLMTGLVARTMAVAGWPVEREARSRGKEREKDVVRRVVPETTPMNTCMPVFASNL